MNREQAQKALRAVDETIDISSFDWDDVTGEIATAKRVGLSSNPEHRAKEERVLAILREHRDYLRTENEALAVWRNVFVARCATVEAGYIGGATDLANDAEAVFRRRRAEHLKAVG